MTESKKIPILGIIISICGLITVAYFGYMVISKVNNEVCNIDYDPIIESTWITSLQDLWSTSGSFFLGSGGISENAVYVYYTGDNKEGYSLATVPASQTKIFMDTNDRPYLLKKRVFVRDNPIMCSLEIRYELHVPENTIVKEFKVDGV